MHYASFLKYHNHNSVEATRIFLAILESELVHRLESVKLPSL